MDSFYMDKSTEDSRQSRSRTNSYLSTAATQLQSLDLNSSVILLDDQERSLSNAATTSTSFSGLESHQLSSNFIAAPAPHQYIPFPLFSENEIDAHWSYNTTPEAQTDPTPLVGLNSAPQSQALGEHSVASRQSRSRPNSLSIANMSAVGIQQFDGRFDASLRPAYTWPQFDMSIMGDQFLPQQLSPGMSSGQLTPYDDPKFIPVYARSLSSSPPRAILTAEQRELKRQRDYARRDSKTRLRRDRSLSTPYSISQRASPNLLPTSMTDYPSTLAPSPLLAHDSPSLAASSYLGPYSPPLMSDDGSSDMYGPVFTMASNDFTGIPAYSLPYSSSGGEPSMPSFAPRQQSLSSASDQLEIYQSHQVPRVGSVDSAEHVRVVHSRPKPQCWEHGCNGRQFSTFSNLLRHQREKSGQASKSSCPNCGAEFTRTTARNGHMAHEKCKQRRNS